MADKETKTAFKAVDQIPSYDNPQADTHTEKNLSKPRDVIFRKVGRFYFEDPADYSNIVNIANRRLKETHVSQFDRGRFAHIWQGDTAKEEKSEHERTRELVSEKIDGLSKELAKTEDLLQTKDEIIQKIEAEADEIKLQMESQIFALQSSLSRFLPHKRAFRISIYFFTLFIFCISAKILGLIIIQPPWDWLGLLISVGFIIMSYCMYLDWNKLQR